jgi:hypothetical protein
MSRPRPKILLDSTDSKTFKSEQVLEADGIYAVFMDGRPINLRSLNKLVDYPGPKYRKVSFSNPGHAFNLRDKLNSMFKTNQFSVVRLITGDIIEENKLV